MVKLNIIIHLMVHVILILLLAHILIFSKIELIKLKLKENLGIKYFILIEIALNESIKNNSDLSYLVSNNKLSLI